MNIKKDWVSGLIVKIKTNRKLEFTIYAVLIGLVLILYFSSFVQSEETNHLSSERSANASVSSEQEVEARLEKILSSIRGAGEVKVMITYETGPEIVPAMSVDKQTNSSSNGSGTTESETESSEPATITQSGGNQPIVLTERQPTIRGVIVIAEGAADIAVQMDLQIAVQTVLGVSASCIEVFEMTSK